MTTSTTSKAPVRIQGKKRITPGTTGTADPRPITEYTAVHSIVSGKSRLTMTLSQPCVIRAPMWKLIDCTANGRISPVGVTVVSNTQFYLDFAGLLDTMVAFVEVPYQDMQVQNFLGGFVRPGGQWFREPVQT